jgi:hypothetical protein
MLDVQRAISFTAVWAAFSGGYRLGVMNSGGSSLSHRAAALALRTTATRQPHNLLCVNALRRAQSQAAPSRSIWVAGLVTALDVAEFVHRDRIGNLRRDMWREDEFQLTAQCQCLRRNVTPLDVCFFVGAQFQKCF